MSPEPLTIHNRLVELRKARGETQEDLASAVGVSRQTIISIERLTWNPSLPLAFLFSAHYGLPIEDIFYVHHDDPVSPNGQHPTTAKG